MSCLKTLNILVLKSLRCLSVNDCLKDYPPKVMPISRVYLFNSLMNLKYVFQVHVRVSKRALAALNTEIATMHDGEPFYFRLCYLNFAG
jgi:hypothetical protein